TPYLAQWWRDAPNLKASNPVRVQFATVTRHVGATLALGGKITGIVRFRNRSGRPLRGMCVFVDGSSALGPVSTGASTARDGSYLIEGLPTGRYSLAFGPGCGSNGNLLYQNYGHLVSVTAGATKRIDAFLQPGGILSGTVTSAAGGTPLHGICVGIGSLGDFTSTRSDGTYSMDQLPPGRYAVSFVGGCGSAGSYAPQWYPGRARSFYAARVTITAAKDTSGIDAAMKPGATISGTVTTRSGYKVSEVCVGALDPGTASAFGELGDTLSRDGSYRIANLAPGQYQVVFFWCGVGAGYAPQWFRSAPGPGRAALVDLPRAATVTGIDAVLRPAGAITGTLSDSAGNPIQFACVSVINRRAGGFSELYDLVIGGGYFIGGLPPGSYDVQFIDCGGVGYATQWYSGKALQRTANPVFVTARHVTKGIDAVLTTKTGSGSISGRVTAKATGRPVGGACAVAYRNGLYAFATTSDNGDYTIKGLSSGSYHVSFSGCRRSTPYAGATRPGLVRVISPGKVTGIDEALVLAGSISGAVLGGLPTPVAEPGICVDVVAAADGALVAFAETGLGGRYLVGHLAPGTYQVYFGDPFCPGGTEGLVPQWYDGKHTRAAATSVVVQPGKASVGVGATLLADGTIAGTVTGPAPASTPLTGICVIARPLNGTSPVYAVSDGGGYSLTGVRPGRYQVEFQSGCGATGYAAQWWNGASSAAGATVITVAPGAVTAGISAAMQG
ncbi:MAG TPA: carboxypeptidase regulatory-like domain-containing protein, partial [Streptosporangiaceae bacterium]